MFIRISSLVLAVLFVYLTYGQAFAQGAGDAVLFIKGERHPSLEAYLQRNDLPVKDVAVEPAADGVDVVGVTPSLQTIIESFQGGVVVSEPLAVGSAKDIEEDLKARLGDSQRPLLLISHNGRVRLMELRADDPVPAELDLLE